MCSGKMAALFRSAVLLVLSPECFEEFFVKFNFLHVPCLKSAISKGLGYGIIVGSLLVKLPQIVKIWNNHSAKGISLWSVLLELFAITATASYSFMNRFPFRCIIAHKVFWIV